MFVRDLEAKDARELDLPREHGPPCKSQRYLCDGDVLNTGIEHHKDAVFGSKTFLLHIAAHASLEPFEQRLLPHPIGGRNE